MRDILRDGGDWLNSKLGTVAAHSIEYRRAGYDALEISASVGQSNFEEASDYGVLIKTETRDYLVLASLIVYDAAVSEPRRGDVVKDGGILYEVLAVANEPCFRYSDPDRKMLRIHTKEIGPD